MAKAYRARCIVLSKTKLGETDVILTMLAEDGRQVRAVAKGLRKPGNRFGARLEPYSVVDALLHPGRSLDVVGEARCVATNAVCREGLERPAAAAVIAEFLDKLTRDGACAGKRVFALTQVALASIGRVAGPDSAALLAAAHLVKAMAMQGLRPATRACALCGTPLTVPQRFDVSAGGSVCEVCASTQGAGLVLAPSTAGWVEVLLGMRFEELEEVGGAPAGELLEFAELWVREHFSLRVKSVSFLKTLL